MSHLVRRLRLRRGAPRQPARTLADMHRTTKTEWLGIARSVAPGLLRIQHDSGVGATTLRSMASCAQGAATGNQEVDRPVDDERMTGAERSP
jgi:hypothetical protein